MAYGNGNLIEKDTIYRVPVPTNKAWAVQQIRKPGFLPYFAALFLLLLAVLYLSKKGRS